MRFDRRSILKMLGLAPMAPLVVPEAAIAAPAAVVPAPAASMLYATPGAWRGGVPTYQWLRNGVPIAGATGTSYTLTVDDVSCEIGLGPQTAWNPQRAFASRKRYSVEHWL